MNSIAGYSRVAQSELLPPDSVVFGTSPAMQAIREKIDKVADTNIPVLLEGESGTGKEVIAKYLHYHSSWSSGAFVKVNCPAIPDTLVESELFGYERGAFTGAHDTKPGRVEAAEFGTLFLDEISELGLPLQSKLLQILQDGKYCPLGGRQDRKVDVRIVCATNRHLDQEVARARFRQDLYYRINVVTLRLPALRERTEDIPVLAEYLVAEHCRQYGCKARPLSSATLAALKTHDWPGNVRELENLTKRYVVLGSQDVIAGEIKESSMKLLPDAATQPTTPFKAVMHQAMRDLQKRILLDTLQANQWNRKRAARALNLSYRALLYKLKEAGLGPQRGASDANPDENADPEFNT